LGRFDGGGVSDKKILIVIAIIGIIAMAGIGLAIQAQKGTGTHDVVCTPGYFLTNTGTGYNCTNPLTIGSNITNKLVGWWKMTEGTGTTATDSSTTANNGVISGGYTWTTSCGDKNGVFSTLTACLLFDGASAQVNITKNTAYDIISGRSFTLSYWFRTNDTATHDNVAMINHGSGNFWTARGVATSPVERLQISNSTVQARSTTLQGALAGNTWHWIMYSYNHFSGTIDLYLDGSLDTAYNNQAIDIISKGTTCTTSVDCNVFIARGILSGGFWSGLMFDMRIYQKSFTSTEMSQQYLWYQNQYGFTA
jgi:hypothetical protein